MARIRTIKPEFFTSEDIVSLSPMARLLYIALWCEADREGRLAWKPFTFKLRYLPADDCDIKELCTEILSRGLVELYGDGWAYIPSFGKHQHVNPRESASTLPDPHASGTREGRDSTRDSRDGTREGRDSDAQVGKEGKEGKGKEGVGDASSHATSAPTSDDEDAASPKAPRSPQDADARGTRLPKEWTLPDEWREHCRQERPDLDPDAVAAGFHDHWLAQPGKDGRRANWLATWRNWVRRERSPAGRHNSTSRHNPMHADDIFASAK